MAAILLFPPYWLTWIQKKYFKKSFWIICHEIWPDIKGNCVKSIFNDYFSYYFYTLGSLYCRPFCCFRHLGWPGCCKICPKIFVGLFTILYKHSLDLLVPKVFLMIIFPIIIIYWNNYCIGGHLHFSAILVDLIPKEVL